LILEWRKGAYVLVVLDTRQILPWALRTIGEWIGCPKGEVDFGSVSDDQLLQYCRRDVEILLEAWRRWVRLVQEEQLGSLAWTLAGQAWRAWRTRYYDGGVWVHAIPEVTAAERESYYGGRVEVRQVGHLDRGAYYLLDSNSHYGAAMRCDIACRYHHSCRAPTHRTVAHALSGSACIARVQLRTETPCYPWRLGDGLLFPVGCFTTTLPDPELRLALERGDVYRIEHLWVYDCAPIFSRWVDAIYQLRLRMREQHRRLEEAQAKRLLVSLYGKFGQRLERWRSYGETDQYGLWSGEEVDADTGVVRSVRQLGYTLEASEGREESEHALPVVAAHITSLGRVRLLQWIEQAGWEHVYYADTDSLIVDRLGLLRLYDQIDRDRLGTLKVQASGDELTIHGPKNYALRSSGELRAHAGRSVLRPEERWTEEHWPSLRGQLRLRSHDPYITVRVMCGNSTTCRKGRVDSRGHVHPWRLPDDLPLLRARFPRASWSRADGG